MSRILSSKPPVAPRWMKHLRPFETNLPKLVRATKSLLRISGEPIYLLMSDATFAELRDVPLRPSLTAKYPFITPQIVSAFVAEIEALSILIANPPNVFGLPRDPKDEPFIDPAVAGRAQFLVTWNDMHLTYLLRHDMQEGKEFCTKFPDLAITSPPEFLNEIRRTGQP